MSHFCGFFLIFYFIIHFVNAACPPLAHKKGVKLECKLPGNNTISDCTSKLPQGTLATFTCDKYNYQDYGPHQGELLCTEDLMGDPEGDDIWEHYFDYEDFNCQIGCGIKRKLSPVIVGGNEANKYDFPWYAAIFERNQTTDNLDFICGGSLIDLKSEGPLILTAAHCLRANYKDYKVILSPSSSAFTDNLNSDSQIFDVEYYVRYPSFNRTSLENDIGLVKLKRYVIYNEGVMPICLERGVLEPKSGDIGIVAGFGKTESGLFSKNMLYAELPMRSRSECEHEIPGKSNFSFPFTKFCAGFPYSIRMNIWKIPNHNKILPSGICHGDSGGGFMVFHPFKECWIIAGISNAAFPDTRLGCSGLGYFQGVQKYIGWIREFQKLFYPNKLELELEELRTRLNQDNHTLEETKTQFNGTIDISRPFTKNCPISPFDKSNILNDGRLVNGLETGIWYTISSKNNGTTNYLSWIQGGIMNFGLVTWNGRHPQQNPRNVHQVPKYMPGESNYDIQWMISKTYKPGQYTLYNRGSRGYLIHKYRKIMNETELNPAAGYYCFTQDTDEYFRIYLCGRIGEWVGQCHPDPQNTLRTGLGTNQGLQSI